MERTVSVPLYIGAFLMSLAIFLLGIYIGSTMDSSHLASISEDVSSVSDRVASVQLLILMEGNSSAFCPVYSSELDAIDNDVEKMGYMLTYLEDEKGVFDNELKKKYFVLEAESYVLSRKVNDLCGDDSTLLINFYSNKDCGRCKEQGTEILQARDELAAGGVGVKLFSFDGELNSSVADALEAQYGVSGYPSVVIDGKTYSGFRTSDELKALIKGSS
ncbi:hypothetical protein H0O00_03855 [Candidatus Micrarchaeota archaeon]|nr:hypothetical protein [Candidatus Micrarchaeota archaeon]